MFDEKQSLAELTWWKIGGLADYIAFPKSINEVKDALAWAKSHSQPVTVLGAGSNVLISDQGIAGLVLCMRQMSGLQVLELEDQIKIECFAGTPKSDLVKVFLKHKLAPALFLCGLPGDVGGGIVMNAGVSEDIVPREFCEIVEWIEVVRDDLQNPIRILKNELQWSYRTSQGWQPGVVVRAGISWPLQPEPEIMNLVKQATKARLQKQPLELPSCGSVFQNPPGNKAGALIEQAGLKGYRVGGAEVSTKHSNFIVNTGGATAADVDAIIRHVQATVQKKFDVSLKPEVKYLGRW